MGFFISATKNVLGIIRKLSQHNFAGFTVFAIAAFVMLQEKAIFGGRRFFLYFFTINFHGYIATFRTLNSMLMSIVFFNLFVPRLVVYPNVIIY